MQPPYKNQSGQYYTRQLFWEESIELSDSMKAIAPVFTLYKNKPGLINFGQEYILSEDPTGYTVAQKLLGEYSHWTILMKSKWFKAAKTLWDDELDARLTARGFNKIQELLKDGPPAQQLAAAKYLADKEYRKDKSASKGRPSKKEIDEKIREDADTQEQLSADFKRISLVK